MKRICVFCASSNNVPPFYHEACTAFGRALADRNCELVFGGGGVGLMGTLAKAVKERGGRVYGVIPTYLRSGEGRFSLCDTLVLTGTLSERKKHMMDAADGFAVLPGGYGTLDEAFEVLTLRRHKLIERPVVFLNTGGFFDPLLEFLENISREGFISNPVARDIYVTGTPEEAAAYLAKPGTEPS